MEPETWLVDPTNKSDLLALLCRNAYLVFDCCLVGDRAPKVQEHYDRMKRPQLGDLVLELSFRMKRAPAHHYLGRLILVRDEPIPDWGDEDPEQPNPGDTYWYIETLEGQLVKWSNCEFITVAEEVTHFYKPEEHIHSQEEIRQSWAMDAMRRHELSEFPFRDYQECVLRLRE